jgi:hypothetical protein
MQSAASSSCRIALFVVSWFFPCARRVPLSQQASARSRLHIFSSRPQLTTASGNLGAKVRGMSATVATTSAVLALSKAAWRTGLSLSALNEDADIIDPAVRELAKEVNLLGIECGQAFTTLAGVTDKKLTAPPSIQPADDTPWHCLAIQVDEASRMIQEVEHMINIVRGEDARFIGQAQHLRKLDKIKEKVAHTRIRVTRHIIDLRFTLLLINM